MQYMRVGLFSIRSVQLTWDAAQRRKPLRHSDWDAAHLRRYAASTSACRSTRVGVVARGDANMSNVRKGIQMKIVTKVLVVEEQHTLLSKHFGNGPTVGELIDRRIQSAVDNAQQLDSVCIHIDDVEWNDILANQGLCTN